MDILNKPINSFKFADVVDFCTQKKPEGWQIDYKREFPKDLTRHISAFSNTRGGIIIMGVEEDRDTGLPKAWEGVSDAAKLVERVYQEASNVEPFPSIDVVKTNEVNGKAFILIRVFEGANTPYYAQNDGRIWVRTGNIKNPIDVGSPDWIELLFNKREKAEKARKNMSEVAEHTYQAALVREEKKRQRTIIEAAKPESDVLNNYPPGKVGDASKMCFVVLQPYNPSAQLVAPKDLKQKVSEYSIDSGYDSFPNRNLKPIPQGGLYFYYRQDGYIECQQLYSQGLLYSAVDVNRAKEGKDTILLAAVAAQLFRMLKLANNFYKRFGYQGEIIGTISLRGMNNTFFKEIADMWDESIESLLDNYVIEIKTNTKVIGDDEALMNYFTDLMNEVYWSVGYENVPKETLINSLKKWGLMKNP